MVSAVAHFRQNFKSRFLSLLISYRPRPSMEANSSWEVSPRWRPFFSLKSGTFGWLKSQKVSHLAICFDFAKSNFQHGGAENFEVFKFQSQKCFWSKFKSRHGCYNPQRIICNHLKLWISWDAQEIKRFSISFGGDIFFATGGSWSQQLISIFYF